MALPLTPAPTQTAKRNAEMAALTYRTKIEFGITATCLAIGGFFTVLALQIPEDMEEIIGPRSVPLFIGVMIMILGVLISALSLITNSNGVDDTLEEGEIPPDDDFGFMDSDIKRVFEVIGCGIIYIALFWAFGYFLATLISLGLMLLAFGNRKSGTLILLPVAGTVIYQAIFMGLMGLHDPAGALIDVSPITNIISGN